MIDVDHTPTSRSRVFGWYFRFRGFVWLFGGFFLVRAWSVSGGFNDVVSIRGAAYFALLFVVPAILLWVLGTVVAMRYKAGWWLAILFGCAAILSKTVVGVGDLTSLLWFWFSGNTLPNNEAGIVAVETAYILIYAIDIAVLMALLSTRARKCYHIGNS